jgi:general secretion pathway protein A
MSRAYAMKTSDVHTTFGFQKIPFTREIAVHDMLPMTHLDEQRDALLEQLERRMSAAIIAPAGAGKSCLLRALRARLPEARYRVHYVKVTDLGKRDLCREIATAIGAEPAGTYPMLVRRLQEHFEQTGAVDGVRTVLVVDEAHDIRPDVLGVLRILTNFEWDSRLVLAVILAGQPKLETMLKQAPLEDVAQRLSYYARLRLLSRDESERYLEHRCAVAGASTVPFDASALEGIFEISRGNLRAIDQLCLAALGVAAKRGAKVVSNADIVLARKHVLL